MINSRLARKPLTSGQRKLMSKMKWEQTLRNAHHKRQQEMEAYGYKLIEAPSEVGGLFVVADTAGKPLAMTRVEYATALGERAFKFGIMRVPHYDMTSLTPLIRGFAIGDDCSPTVAVLDAWLRAWDRANLAAPVEGIE